MRAFTLFPVFGKVSRSSCSVPLERISSVTVSSASVGRIVTANARVPGYFMVSVITFFAPSTVVSMML